MDRLNSFQIAKNLTLMEYRLQQIYHSGCCGEYLADRFEILTRAIRDKAIAEDKDAAELCWKFIAAVHKKKHGDKDPISVGMTIFGKKEETK